MTRRRVYVVGLSGDIGLRENPDFPNVYVGETGLSAEERFAKHKAGGRTASKKVTYYGIKLRPDLYEYYPDWATEEESVAAEKKVCLILETKGYTVLGGTMGMSESFRDRAD